jgi:cytidylate kinase
VALVPVTGPPASGKTTIARPLARQLGVPLLGVGTTLNRMAWAGPAAQWQVPEPESMNGVVGSAAKRQL